MTLSDEAYQELRDAGAAVIREVGVETGGANIQFARERETGELRVIEMNPRVSRSSALASKATGYPIAKVAAKLAVGLHARRDPQRPDRHDSGQLRAHARLRRRQVPAVRVREVSRRRPHARHADEVRRRGDGNRPHRSPRRSSRRSGRGSSTTPGSRATSIRGSRPSSSAREWNWARLDSVDQLVADDWLRLKRAGWSDGAIADHCGTSEEIVRRSGGRAASGPATAESTPAPPRSRPRRRTTTPPGARRTRRRRPVTSLGS